jgi:hypothetical protein
MVRFCVIYTYYILGVPIPIRKQADFRGTITYASLNAHLKIVSALKMNYSLIGFGQKR